MLPGKTMGKLLRGLPYELLINENNESYFLTDENIYKYDSRVTSLLNSL